MNLDDKLPILEDKTELTKACAIGAVALATMAVASPAAPLSPFLTTYAYNRFAKGTKSLFTPEEQLDQDLAFAMGWAFKFCLVEIEAEWKAKGYRELQLKDHKAAKESLELLKFLGEYLPQFVGTYDKQSLDSINIESILSSISTEAPHLKAFVESIGENFTYGFPDELKSIIENKLNANFFNRLNDLLAQDDPRFIKANAALNRLKYDLQIQLLGEILSKVPVTEAKLDDLQQQLLNLEYNLSNGFSALVGAIAIAFQNGNFSKDQFHLLRLIENTNLEEISEHERQIVDLITPVLLEPPAFGEMETTYLPPKLYTDFVKGSKSIKGVIKQVEKALESPNGEAIINLHGLGGSGKTTILRETAEQIIKGESNIKIEGIVWIKGQDTMTEVSEELLIKEIAKQLQLTLPEDPDARKSELKRALNKSNVLIILDKIETIVDKEQVVRTALDLISNGPGKVLTASTTPLNIPEARNIQVKGFQEADTKKYLKQKLDKQLKDPNAIDAIHRATGGLPSAIEFVAALLNKGTPLDVILEDLKNIDPATDVQRLYERIFARSWDTLGIEEKQLLIASSLFRSIEAISVDLLQELLGQAQNHTWQHLRNLQDMLFIGINDGQVYLNPLTFNYVRRIISHDEELTFRRNEYRTAVINKVFLEARKYTSAFEMPEEDKELIFYLLKEMYEEESVQFIDVFFDFKDLWIEYRKLYPQDYSKFLDQGSSYINDIYKTPSLTQQERSSLQHDLLLLQAQMYLEVDNLTKARLIIDAGIAKSKLENNSANKFQFLQLSLKLNVIDEDFTKLRSTLEDFNLTVLNALEQQVQIINQLPAQITESLAEKITSALKHMHANFNELAYMIMVSNLPQDIKFNYASLILNGMEKLTAMEEWVNNKIYLVTNTLEIGPGDMEQ